MVRVKLALWYNEIEEFGYDTFTTVANSIENHYERILNYFVNRRTNAAAEAFNAKIKAFKASFCGVVDKRFFLVVAVTNSSRYGFNRCKSTTCKFLSRDTKSARDKNGTKPRKNKVKNTSPEISLVEYLCFVCKGTNLSLEKRGEIPISLIHNSFSYHCNPNVVIANGFDLKRHGLRKSCVKFCFALCWTFSKTRTGNRTKDLPPLLSNPWFCECLNDRHLKMLNFK